MSVVKYRESHYVRVLVLYAKDLIFEIWRWTILSTFER